MDKSNSNWDKKWYKIFSRGLFLAMLAGRWNDIDLASRWLDWDMGFEYIGPVKADYDFAYLYYDFAETFRSIPMLGIEKLDKKASKFTRVPKSLYDTWKAGVAEDQEQFSSKFIDSLKLESKRKRHFSIEFDQIFSHHSVVAMAARYLGLVLPELPAKLAAGIVLPEKLGLK